MYNGFMQFPCMLQFKGEKDEDGNRKPVIGRGGDRDAGTDWFAMASVWIKVNSEALFRAIASDKGISDDQISKWIESAESAEAGISISSGGDDVEAEEDSDVPI